MDDDLKKNEMEDDLKKNKMEDNLIFKAVPLRLFNNKNLNHRDWPSIDIILYNKRPLSLSHLKKSIFKRHRSMDLVAS